MDKPLLLAFVVMCMISRVASAACDKGHLIPLPPPGETELSLVIDYLNAVGVDRRDACRGAYYLMTDDSADAGQFGDGPGKSTHGGTIGCGDHPIFELFKGDVDNDGAAKFVLASAEGAEPGDALLAIFRIDGTDVHLVTGNGTDVPVLPGIASGGENLDLPGRLSPSFLVRGCDGMVYMNFIDRFDDTRLHRYLWKNGTFAEVAGVK